MDNNSMDGDKTWENTPPMTWGPPDRAQDYTSGGISFGPPTRLELGADGRLYESPIEDAADE